MLAAVLSLLHTLSFLTLTTTSRGRHYDFHLIEIESKVKEVKKLVQITELTRRKIQSLLYFHCIKTSPRFSLCPLVTAQLLGAP